MRLRFRVLSLMIAIAFIALGLRLAFPPPIDADQAKSLAIAFARKNAESPISASAEYEISAEVLGSPPYWCVELSDPKTHQLVDIVRVQMDGRCELARDRLPVASTGR